MMRKLLGAIAMMGLFTTTVKAQIPNNGFENWTTVSSYTTPDNWDNLNSVTSLMSIYTCTKGTPGSAGAAYLKLTSKTVTGFGVVPGVAVCGVINKTTFKPQKGFAFASQPKSLTGSWQYMASGADQGSISVILTKWNSVGNKRDTIAKANQKLTGMAMSWASFTINLTYVSSAMPDSAMIIASASGTTPVNGSYLYLDNLSFTGTVTNVNEIGQDNSFSVFPNPSSNTLSIHLKDTKSVNKIELLDMQGKVVKQINTSTTDQNFSVDISELAVGSYIIKLTSSEGVINKKFLKQ